VAQTREKPQAEIGSMDDGHSSIPFCWLFFTFSLLFLILSFFFLAKQINETREAPTTAMSSPGRTVLSPFFSIF
jgi:hypothetical protein